MCLDLGSDSVKHSAAVIIKVNVWMKHENWYPKLCSKLSDWFRYLFVNYWYYLRAIRRQCSKNSINSRELVFIFQWYDLYNVYNVDLKVSKSFYLHPFAELYVESDGYSREPRTPCLQALDLAGCRCQENYRLHVNRFFDHILSKPCTEEQLFAAFYIQCHWHEHTGLLCSNFDKFILYLVNR